MTISTSTLIRLDDLPAGTAIQFPQGYISHVGAPVSGGLLILIVTGRGERSIQACLPHERVRPLTAAETAALLATAQAAQDIASAAEHTAARTRGAAMDADQGAFLTYDADPTATTWLAYLATTDRYIAADHAWHQAQEDLTAADRALTIAARAHQVALAREAEAAPCA